MRSGQHDKPVGGKSGGRGAARLQPVTCPVQSVLTHLQVNVGLGSYVPCLPALPAELWPRPPRWAPVHPSAQGRL